MTPDQTLKNAQQLCKSGQYAQAESVCRQILSLESGNAIVLHLLGVTLARQRRHAEAIDAYRRALAVNPDYLDALNNLGAALQETGKINDAIATYEKAIALNPDIAGMHNNLGNALQSVGKLDEAIISHRRAIELNPKMPEAHNSLANELRSKGQLDDAIASYRIALALRSDYAQALNNLACTLSEKGNSDESLALAQKVVALHPKYADGHNTLGTALKARGKLDEALVSYQTAVALNPRFADALNNLAITLIAKGKIDQAIEICQRAVAIKPDFAEAHNNIGVALKEKGLHEKALKSVEKALALKPMLVSAQMNLGLLYREGGNLDESLAWFDQALAIDPQNPIALNGLGNTEKDCGNVEEAISLYRQAINASGGSSILNSNFLYTLHFRPDYDAKSILEFHRQWNDRVADPLREERSPSALGTVSSRRIRVGYVSVDMRGHVVGRHLLPLLANHDRKQFEIFCYTGVRSPDSFTDQLREHADHWRNNIGQSDADLAQLVRADGIDILVDLTLHMSGTRLLAFARKPAPIQLTWLGYCSTTGLAAMDYRLSDPHLDPIGTDENYVEETIRLPRTYWCYQIKGATPDVSPPPAASADHITFGCLNNFAKVSRVAQETWARLLASIPNAHIIIHCARGSHRENLIQRFANAGVGADRIHFFPMSPWEPYMRQYGQIDIALDSFPYGGGITTCDALWMGVPVITLTGQTAVGRGGTSILSNLHLEELIAKTSDEYIQIAAKLAKDLARLTSLRHELRERMRNSVLMDASGFAKDFESIYRDLIQKHV